MIDHSTLFPPRTGRAGRAGRAGRHCGTLGFGDHGVAFAFCAGYVGWLVSTARSLGFPRDEGFYFRAATDYARWFKLLFSRPSAAFVESTVDGMWSYNHEHPALMKSLFGLSWLAFHQTLHVFTDASTAFRFPAMVMGGVAVGITYLFGAEVYSRRAGAIGAASLALMPHVFFHAHLACFDVPIMTMWTVCIYAHYRAQKDGGLGWALAVGIAYGLTLETKHNAWVLPAVLVPHALFVHRRAILRGLDAGRLALPSSLVAMATLGPALFVALWPWLWHDTIPRIQEYANFHLHHEYYNIEFLHKNYFGPPSPKAYAPVMIAATVPTVTLLCFLLGAGQRTLAVSRRLVRSAREAIDKGRGRVGSLAREATEPAERAETDLLLGLAIAAGIAPFFLRATPIFGGTKHWMTSYPLMAMVAGHGFDLVAHAAGRAWANGSPKLQRGLEAALVASVVVAPLAITIHSHPFGLGAYVPLVGGTAGGADMGLYRSFWGYTTQNVEPYFEKLPRGDTVFIHDTAWDSWARMQDEKRVRGDLRAVSTPSEADVALVHYELHMLESEYQNWIAEKTLKPDDVITHDGVPYVGVYRRSR